MTAEGGYGMRTAVYALFTRWSMFFAVVTLASSALQLVQGDDADTNSHILNRAAICLIVSFMTIILERLRLKSRVLSALAGYLLTMAAAFAYVGVSACLTRSRRTACSCFSGTLPRSQSYILRSKRQWTGAGAAGHGRKSNRRLRAARCVKDRKNAVA